MSLRRRMIRIVFTFLHRLGRTVRKASGAAAGAGVHAVPVTAAGKVVLVLLTYAPGWRLPGGGLKRGEAAEEAMLRELREEIGLLSHGRVERIEDPAAASAGPRDGSSLYLVSDVVYRPRRSLEVEAVAEFDPDALPADTSSWTAAILSARIRLRRRTAPPPGG